MIRAAAISLLLALLVPASAGTSTARPLVALRASPVRVALDGAEQATIRVVNTGSRTALVDVTRAGFALDLRGRPRVVRPGRLAAVGWLTLRPSRLVLRPGGTARLTIVSRPPAFAEPGDHDALVLLTTHAQAADRVAVRMRLGVIVVVRAPGTVVHRLEARTLAVRRVGRTRAFELLVVNRGNVTERIDRSRIGITLRRAGRTLATLRPAARDVRPRTRGLVEFRYRGRVRGPVTAVLTLTSRPGSVMRRVFHLGL